jgi:cellulose synthase/poly-beta-1,6-N-acetylglucosamine synthase-like glycosyltransferase
LVSIVIRTKNEERWITPCLRAVFGQTHKNVEVIIVDNGSTDRTIMRAREYPVEVTHIDDFRPGKAINDGVRASRGEVIVCLSGHCVPVNEFWLENLIRDLRDPHVAGVYGRQEPLSYSSDFDKRDLLTVFGMDKKVQIKDSFFHNANSALRREVWERCPFDELVTNIEDRVWGQRVIADGLKIVYEPDARVYHWHGIHQDLDTDRARSVVRILESLNGFATTGNHIDPADLRTVAVIPVRGESRVVGGKALLEYTIRAAREAKYIRDVIVATDSDETANLAISLGARAPFRRPIELSADYVDVLDVIRYTLDRIEAEGTMPDVIMILEETYPFRRPAMLDAMIRQLLSQGLDTVIAARRETRGIWLQTPGETRILAEGFMPRRLKRSQAMIGLVGLGCATYPALVRQGNVLGGKVGIFEIGHPLSVLEVQDAHSMELAHTLIDGWWAGESGSSEKAS